MSRISDRQTRTSVNHTVPAPEEQWYALHVLSGKERRVVENIARLVKEQELGSLIFQTLVPTEKVEDVRNGKKYVVERKLFPGYVYINMALRNEDGSLNNDAWYKILAVDGVISFASGRREPHPMRASQVADLLAQVEACKDIARPKVSFEVGDFVKVLDGAFQGQNGKIEEVDADHGKVRVGVEIFGRTTPVDLDYSQVALLTPDELEDLERARNAN